MSPLPFLCQLTRAFISFGTHHHPSLHHHHHHPSFTILLLLPCGLLPLLSSPQFLQPPYIDMGSFLCYLRLHHPSLFSSPLYCSIIIALAPSSWPSPLTFMVVTPFPMSSLSKTSACRSIIHRSPPHAAPHSLLSCFSLLFSAPLPLYLVYFPLFSSSYITFYSARGVLCSLTPRHFFLPSFISFPALPSFFLQ